MSISYALKAHSFTKCLEIDLSCRISLDIVTCCGILLVTCHSRDRVIYDNDSRVWLVVSNICKSCHTWVHECWITDYGNSLFLALSAANFVKSVNCTDWRIRKRDPRGWVISIAYKVVLNDSNIKPLANTDAINADWYNIKSLEKDKLAFDHYEIIQQVMKNSKG